MSYNKQPTRNPAWGDSKPNPRSPPPRDTDYEDFQQFQRFKQMQRQEAYQDDYHQYRSGPPYDSGMHRPPRAQDNRVHNNRGPNDNRGPNRAPRMDQGGDGPCTHKPITKQLVAATLHEEFSDLATCPYREVTIKYYCFACKRVVFINPLAVGVCYGTDLLFVHFKKSKPKFERPKVLDYTHKKLDKDLLEQYKVLIEGAKAEEKPAASTPAPAEEVDPEEAQRKAEEEIRRQEQAQAREKVAKEKEAAVVQRKMTMPPPKSIAAPKLS